MTQPVLCIYRADCADSLLAAWAAHRALPDAEFVAAKRGDIPPYCGYNVVQGLDGGFLRGRDILILGDIYPLPTLRAMAAEARSVGIIVGGEEAFEFGLDREEFIVSLDPRRATCGIAWDYLHLDKPFDRLLANAIEMRQLREDELTDKGRQTVARTKESRPRIIDLGEDHALGRLQHGDETRAFVAVLRSYDWTDVPAMLERLDRWHEAERADAYIQGEDGYGWKRDAWSRVLHEGRAILRADRQRLAREGE